MTDAQKLERLDYLSSLPLQHTSEDWDEELALECELQDHTFYLVIGHEVNEDGEFSLVQKTFASSEKLNKRKTCINVLCIWSQSSCYGAWHIRNR